MNLKLNFWDIDFFIIPIMVKGISNERTEWAEKCTFKFTQNPGTDLNPVKYFIGLAENFFRYYANLLKFK